MKKLAAVLILAAAITMTGCQGSKQEEKPAASKTEEVNQASDELKEKLGDGYILPSEAVTKVLAKILTGFFIFKDCIYHIGINYHIL